MADLLFYFLLVSLGDVAIPAQVSLPRVQIRKLEITPPTAALKINVPPGTFLDRVKASEIAAGAERQLREEGYRQASVDFSLEPVSTGKADLHLMVNSGERVRVRKIRFSGEPAISARDLDSNLRALHIRRILPGWKLLPGYSPEAVASDLLRLRSLYFSRGYFNASMHVAETSIEGKDARLQVEIESGPHSDGFNGRAACSSLLAERRAAQARGILEFGASIDVPSLKVSSVPGQPYRVRRIEFRGNRHYSDALLRRSFLLEEGQLFDEMQLRKSIGRLERAALFEPIDASHVVIHTDPDAGVADVAILLTERKRGSWNFSGPAGPVSIGGPLQASIGTRLPSWLSSFTISVGIAAFAHPLIPGIAATKVPLLPVLALQRPFTPAEGWRSGFTIAPQLGWYASAVTYTVNQAQQRLLPVLAGNASLIPELPVAIEGSSSGGGVMFCEPPKPRFTALRTTASLALRFAGVLGGL